MLQLTTQTAEQTRGRFPKIAKVDVNMMGVVIGTPATTCVTSMAASIIKDATDTLFLLNGSNSPNLSALFLGPGLIFSSAFSTGGGTGRSLYFVLHFSTILSVRLPSVQYTKGRCSLNHAIVLRIDLFFRSRCVSKNWYFNSGSSL